VRARRRRMGLSQDELASLSHLETNYLSEIEQGAREMTLRSLMSLAESLEVTAGTLLARAPDPDEAPHPSGPALPHASGCAILMVEDNPTDAALTARVFKREGITNPLSIVPDAEEAMEFLFGKGKYSVFGPAHPQFILLDLNLPRMSGLEFLRRVKGYPSTRSIPVVVLTATRDPQIVKECGRLGAESYIIKPFSIGSLVRATPNLALRLAQAQAV